MELKAQLSGWLKLLSSYLMDITAPYSGSSGGKKIIKMWWSHTQESLEIIFKWELPIFRPW